MAQAEASDLFNCSVEEFHSIITDYPRYPEFLDEVKKCTVVEEDGNRKLVEYQISKIKSFVYRLWMTESPNKLVWELESGDLFKESVGAWELSDEAGKARANYQIDAKFKLFIPGPIAKGLVNVSLPAMMSAYHMRVKELYE